MGLAMASSSLSLKRNAFPSDLENPLPKKPSHSIHRHRHLKHSTEGIASSIAFDQNAQGADDALLNSVAFALQAVGFDGAEPAAIEALQNNAEEYMTHFLSHIRQCMLASRRARPIPEDFLQALHNQSLSLRSLLPHLDPPVPASKSQRRFPLDDAEPPFTTPSSSQSLLFQTQHEDQAGYIPAHFPALPSKHSYRETIELPTRERDPKQIRERATEEGRMGEEALRRLLSGARAQRRGSVTHTKDADRTGGRGLVNKRMRLKAERRELWEEVMQLKSFDDTGAAGNAGGGEDAMEIDMGEPRVKNKNEAALEPGHISAAVNYEKRYWRKVPTQRAGETNGNKQNGV